MKANRKIVLILPILLATIVLPGCKNKPAPVAAKVSAVPVGIEIGNLAPDLSYASADGKTFTLSALRGKLVLVDFWASWCMPCRIENPNLVKIYSEYKDKSFTQGQGFTIYSVSLDTKKEAWQEAIVQDGLVWENQVSDLQGWHSEPAATYQISFIPSNLLLNGEGVIIAKNLRAEDLANKIRELAN